MEIKVIKERKVTDFTFLDDGLNLQIPENSQPDPKKDKSEQDFRLRESGNINKLKKSRTTGGHGLQGHSPVYE